MVVLAIIGIMTVLAVGVASGQNQVARLNQSATDIQSDILRARAEAVRTGVLQKVCLFADAASNDAVPLGVLLRFRCFSAGDQSCSTAAAGGTICSSVNATAPTNLTSLYDTAQAGCITGQWCLSTDPNENLDFSVSGTHSSISGFAQAPKAPLAGSQPALELTFNSLGIIDQRRSTAGYQQGTVFISSYDFCSPGIPPAGSCTGITRSMRASYVLGGNVQVTR